MCSALGKRRNGGFVIVRRMALEPILATPHEILPGKVDYTLTTEPSYLIRHGDGDRREEVGLFKVLNSIVKC